MKKTFIPVACAAMSALLLSACSSGNASYVESGGARSVVTTNKINIADWNNAASALVNDIISSGILDKYPQPVKISVSRIINRTSQAIETDLLTSQICIALNNTGKILAKTEDQKARDIAQYEEMMSGKTVAVEKMTISGKIIEDRDSNSDVKEVTYVFMLNLNADGAAVWQGQKQISKQSSKSSFGF